MQHQIHIELLNIGKRYQNQWLFRHVALSLRTGDTLALTGRNGSGKSTLMQILYGLVQPTEGEVLLNGSKETKPHLHFAFTSPYMELPLEFSLEEIHGLFLRSKKLSLEFDAFLDYSGFSKAQSHKAVKFFSSGMLQRMKTALCLCSDAPVLLLDEPLTNMDSQGEIWYKNCVKDIRNRIVVVAGNNPSEYEFSAQNLQLSEKV